MIDIKPLEDVVQAEKKPELKAVLQVVVDLLGSGYTSHFTRLYKKGSHVDLMGSKGDASFEKVINQSIEAEEELKRETEKPNESEGVIVCGLASPQSKEGKDAMLRRTAMPKHVSRLGKQKMSPLESRLGKSAFLRSERGKGVKVCDPDDDEVLKVDQPEVEKVKVKEEAVDFTDEEMTDGEVQIINEGLFHYLVQMSEQEKDELTNLLILSVYNGP